jgi:hypothetical protein
MLIMCRVLHAQMQISRVGTREKDLAGEVGEKMGGKMGEKRGREMQRQEGDRHF